MTSKLGMHWLRYHQDGRVLCYNTGVVNQKSDRGGAGNTPRPEQQYGGTVTMPHSTPQPSALKVCSKCGESKPHSDFRHHKTGRMAGAPRSTCRECDLAIARAYKARNRERLNEEYRLRIANDPGYRKKRNDKSRAWRERNRQHITEYNATRFEENPEAMRAAIKASDKKNPERRKAHKAVYYAVKVGKLPPAWSMVCEDCQESAAANYHHHKGYSEEYKLDVIALCTECHGKAHRVN